MVLLPCQQLRRRDPERVWERGLVFLSWVALTWATIADCVQHAWRVMLPGLLPGLLPGAAPAPMCNSLHQTHLLLLPTSHPQVRITNAGQASFPRAWKGYNVCCR